MCAYLSSKQANKFLVKNECVRRGRSRKLEAPYVGPYEIVGIEGPNLLLRTTRSKTLKIHAKRAIFAWLQMWTIFAWPLLCSNNRRTGYRLPNWTSSPGLYYQPVGTARLYSNEWTVVTYLSLEGASKNEDAIRKYTDFTIAFCIRHSNLWQPNPKLCNSMLYTVKK